MIEEWKTIDGFEGYYEISNIGRVKSLERRVAWNGTTRLIREKILSVFKDCWGYSTVDLRKDNIRKVAKVHRLVALSFIPNIYNKPEVNHIDGVKSNCNIKNLEWVTASENMLHASNKGLVDINKALNSRRKSVICVNTGETYKSATEAAKSMGLVRRSVSRVAQGTRKSIHGYKFKFVKL